jgi:toxin ParE1/3/4
VGEVNWTAEALRWLEDIFEYIATENPVAATRVATDLYERSQVLAEFPDIGYRYQNSTRPVRILLVGHYRIAYLRKPDGDIDILGVFHSALDITHYQL